VSSAGLALHMPPASRALLGVPLNNTCALTSVPVCCPATPRSDIKPENTVFALVAQSGGPGGSALARERVLKVRSGAASRLHACWYRRLGPTHGMDMSAAQPHT
jgi:hypothetical protein